MKHFTKLILLSFFLNGFSHAGSESFNRAIRRVIHKIASEAQADVTFSLLLSAQGHVRLLLLDRNTGTMHVHEINLDDEDFEPVIGTRRAHMLDNIVYETAFITRDELLDGIRDFNFEVEHDDSPTTVEPSLPPSPSPPQPTAPQPNYYAMLPGQVMFFHPGYWVQGSY